MNQRRQTSKKQVTFPAAVFKALGAEPGTHLEIQERNDGPLLRARVVDRAKLAPLRRFMSKVSQPFNVETFRNESHGPSLRDVGA